jgi:hypothetical protein
MSNTRQAALDELRHIEKQMDALPITLTLQTLQMMRAVMKSQNSAMRRVFEYAEAVALET